jgi:hypothetical protein
MGTLSSDILHCMPSLKFRKLFDLSDLPSGWSLVRLALDWSGHPLLLIVEGKPTRPEHSRDMEAFTRWYRTPPTAHHLIYWSGDTLKTVSFKQAQGLSTFHIQPFKEGWLLGERRGGRATAYDRSGSVRAFLELGDASEDLQTTPDGRIWVSYFDEGVFGGGIGSQGLVCFDTTGTTTFRYAEFAEQNDLPHIADCYAMNVLPSGEVWLNYYTDFPLVKLREYAVEQVWREVGAMGNGFAIRDGVGFYLRDTQLMSRVLEPLEEPIELDAIDEQGGKLLPVSTPHVGLAARGANLVINTGTAIYELVT